MNTTPFFCFPGSWSRVKSPLGLGEIFFHFFYSGVIKISCKISKIIQQIIIFKTKAGSVQVIKNNQVVFRNLLSFSPGLLVNFFQNFLPILFKKVNFCFFRIFWFFPEVRKGSWEEELEEDKLALALAKLSLEILACHFFCGIYFFHWLKQRRLFWGQSSSLLLLLQCWDKSCQNPQK